MISLLLTYYGDDFSGSTDVMEALSVRGIPTVLFLRPPTLDDLARFPDCLAAGVAGLSRSQSPEWMARNLPPIFEALRALGAPLCHYKLCSTFDSSPTHGSIGKAIELGRQVFGTACVPLVVGAPALRRYVIFGNLFASADGEHYRIDRHPTMSRHPVTPMDEGDLLRHLSHQTQLTSALVDILCLEAGRGLERFDELRRQGAAIVFFDTLDAGSLKEVGRAIWESRSAETMFVAGSSGVEYALLEWWDSRRELPARPALVDAGSIDRLLVVSGSCSPGTACQIQWAMRNGFEGIALDPARFVEGSAEFDRVFLAAQTALAGGRSVVVYSAMGPASIVDTASLGGDFGNQLGLRLGRLAGELVRQCNVRRTVIAGGDASGHAGTALNIQALTMVRPFAPGSPLCRMWSEEAAVNGGEILMKGGQVGGEQLFGEVRRGRPGAITT